MPRSKEKKLIKVDETDPVGEIEPSFPWRDVVIKRNVDIKQFYDLQSEIGRGKFGTVYRCKEKSTGMTLAAKFVGIAKRNDRRNVEREVEIMRELQHPRLIQIYDAFESSNVMCVVLELIEGGELFERVIDDDFVLTEKAVAIFMRQICEGVDFIHSKNVLHLDMKPENILCLTKTGNRIKIIDFGLARKFDPEKKLQVLFGTPEFVAPEVVNFDAIGYGTDMWSVGVICYVLLSGLSPFMGETDIQTMGNVTVAQYDFDDECFNEISEDAKDFIRKLLLKDKEARMTAPQSLQHPWLSRHPTPDPNLANNKENIRECVERWSPEKQLVALNTKKNLKSSPPTSEKKLKLDITIADDAKENAPPNVDKRLHESQTPIEVVEEKKMKLEIPPPQSNPQPNNAQNKMEVESSIALVMDKKSKLHTPPTPEVTNQTDNSAEKKMKVHTPFEPETTPVAPLDKQNIPTPATKETIPEEKSSPAKITPVTEKPVLPKLKLEISSNVSDTTNAPKNKTASPEEQKANIESPILNFESSTPLENRTSNMTKMNMEPIHPIKTNISSSNNVTKMEVDTPKVVPTEVSVVKGQSPVSPAAKRIEENLPKLPPNVLNTPSSPNVPKNKEEITTPPSTMINKSVDKTPKPTSAVTPTGVFIGTKTTPITPTETKITPEVGKPLEKVPNPETTTIQNSPKPTTATSPSDTKKVVESNVADKLLATENIKPTSSPASPSPIANLQRTPTLTSVNQSDIEKKLVTERAPKTPISPNNDKSALASPQTLTKTSRRISPIPSNDETAIPTSTPKTPETVPKTSVKIISSASTDKLIVPASNKVSNIVETTSNKTIIAQVSNTKKEEALPKSTSQIVSSDTGVKATVEGSSKIIQQTEQDIIVEALPKSSSKASLSTNEKDTSASNFTRKSKLEKASAVESDTSNLTKTISNNTTITEDVAKLKIAEDQTKPFSPVQNKVLPKQTTLPFNKTTQVSPSRSSSTLSSSGNKASDSPSPKISNPLNIPIISSDRTFQRGIRKSSSPDPNSKVDSQTSASKGTSTARTITSQNDEIIQKISELTKTASTSTLPSNEAAPGIRTIRVRRVESEESKEVTSEKVTTRDENGEKYKKSTETISTSIVTETTTQKKTEPKEKVKPTSSTTNATVDNKQNLSSSGNKTDGKPNAPTSSNMPIPRIITHKIHIEDAAESTSSRNEKDQKLNPEDYRSDRRASDISCFFPGEDDFITEEINRLSDRLKDLKSSSFDNGSGAESLLNRMRRPKYKISHCSRDVPVNSPPPPSNMTYYMRTSQSPRSQSPNEDSLIKFLTTFNDNSDAKAKIDVHKKETAAV